MQHGSDMFACTNCQKREFQMTQLSEMRLLAECAGCGASFVVDSISEKKCRIEAADPNQHIIWKSEQASEELRGNPDRMPNDRGIEFDIDINRPFRVLLT